MEFDLIDLIRARTAVPRADVALGIGDDAALLVPPAGQALAVAIDTLVEGVHFPVGTAPSDIGWKALAVNLSDLAAMGATPAWAMLALTMPAADRVFVESFADGFARLARQHDVALVGGDTTRGSLAVSVGVHGFVSAGEALRRDGARVGDAILITGTLGDAAAALRCLDAHDAAALALRTRLDRPTPRVAAGLALRGQAHACIDVSDGLLADLAHICHASGVAAIVDAHRLPLSLALQSRCAAAMAQELALTGGDDYELCFTVAPEQAAVVTQNLVEADCPVTCIGRIVVGAGVRVLDADGADITPAHRGWEHFHA
ncbi:MAG TPA: thiamine-phosphate kinase [Rhodanobacteraceae bacterium]